MEKIIRKMLTRDVAVVVGFGVFLWVTMCFIAFSILVAVGASSVRNIIIAIGVITLLFATLSLLALILHLRKNCNDIYAEELLHAQVDSAEIVHEEFVEENLPSPVESTGISGSKFMKVFDILFVMVLCFATLLATMLLRDKPVEGEYIYTIKLPSVLLTVIGFTWYFIYILRHSHKELKVMVDDMYVDEAQTGAAAPSVKTE